MKVNISVFGKIVGCYNIGSGFVGGIGGDVIGKDRVYEIENIVECYDFCVHSVKLECVPLGGKQN